jgi:hypothetical protein
MELKKIFKTTPCTVGEAFLPQIPYPVLFNRWARFMLFLDPQPSLIPDCHLLDNR